MRSRSSSSQQTRSDAVRHVWLPLVLIASLAGCRQAPPTVPTSVPLPKQAPQVKLRQPPPSLAALMQVSVAFRFDHLSPDMGLSQSVVTDMVQDEQGFLWFGTQDGLNRYDGHEFRVFKDDPATANSPVGNLVASLALAPSGELWFGTNDGGLNRYCPRTGRFLRYVNDFANPNTLAENSVSAVSVDRAGTVWVGTSNRGLDRLDPATGAFAHYVNDPNDPSSLSDNNITSLWTADDGTVWIGTLGGGLNQMDASGRFVNYRYDPDEPGSISDDLVQTLYMDAQGLLWIGSFAGGLSCLDPQTGKCIHYGSDPNDPTSLGANSVSAVFEDRNGRLWVGCQGGGLNMLDRQTGHFARLQHDPGTSDSLSNDSVMCILEDSAGIVWFGTFGSGADYYDPGKWKFPLLRPVTVGGDGLSSGALWAVYQDRQDVVWIATNDHGLDSFDLSSGIWRHYVNDPANPQSLNSNAAYVVYEDHLGALWVGTPAGLNRLDRATGQFERYATPTVLAIREDSRQNLWLGTPQGLILFDRASGAQRVLRNDPLDPTSLSSDSVSVVFEDSRQRLWIGSMNGGLNLFDRDTGRFTRYVRDLRNPMSLSSNTVLCISQARDGTLWIGTSGGLNKFEPDTGEFVAYRERDGLPNDAIYGIVEDDGGRLWLSTNKGLARFDPRTLSCRNYDKSDGLQNNEFDQWSFFRNGEGVVFFGGVGGLNVFHPDLIEDSSFAPPVVITGFRLANETVPVGPDSPLQQPVEFAPSIRLSPGDRFFELSYAALHYSAPNRIRFAYKLEELDKDWNDAGGRRFANYTSVPPGRYTFRVRATNCDGVWNDQGAVLEIILPPPFWQTLWFRLLSALAVLGAATGILALRFRAIELQRRRLAVLVDERTRELRDAMVELEHSRDAAQAASRAKSAFLANMSHEFRTPLNAILGFSQILTRDKRLSAEQRDDIAIIHRGSEHLLGLINDVLEMSRIEAGRTTLHLHGFDLHNLLKGLEEMFALSAENKGIAFELRVASDLPRYVRGDEGKLRQVLMNLLGNAVKFTKQGRIELTAVVRHSADESEVLTRFAVEDTGPGMTPEEVESLFVPFVQTASGRQSQEGTGLGLAISQQHVRLMGGEITVDSEPSRGSVFSFELPLERVEPGELETPPLTRRVVGLEGGQPAYRMLVVDDREVNRHLILRLLAPLGFELREAANGQEALQVWQEWDPHLIWMDMRMPVMDGYEATRRIKSSTRGMATVIVALTASALEEDRAVILSEGCDDYVRKPFREQELYDAIARHLAVRFVYEDVDRGKVVQEGHAAEDRGVASPEEQFAHLVARLAETEAAWRDDLERAALLGDVRRVEEVIAEIANAQPEFAEDLNQLAGAFDHQTILTAIQQSRARAR